MHGMRRVLVVLLVAGMAPGAASAQSFEADVTPLLDASCLQCHGPSTVTPLNLTELGFDLTDHATFRTWQQIYERVDKGEMPPPGARRPEAALVETALGSLQHALVDANLAARGGQRTPLRRLTRLEYGYTLHDLLGIDEYIANDLSLSLPAEADSGGIDTVAANQSMSPLHVRSYLEAADRALDAAIVTGPPPPSEPYFIDYAESQYLYFIGIAEQLGLGSVKKLDDGFVQFFDFTSSYTFHSSSEGFAVPYPGRYRVTIDAYPYQAFSPVTLMVYRGSLSGVAASLDELIGTFDLEGPRTIELTPFMRPGHLIGVSPADVDMPPDANPYEKLTDPAKGYAAVIDEWPSEGIAFKSMTIEGPLFDAWPPPSTRELLVGVDFDADGYVQLTKEPYEHVADIVAAFAPRAFRRPVSDDELEAYASLARPLLDEGRPFVDAVRVPLRAILSAPSFLFHAGASGKLDDFSLATRLSYFLWRSMPDAELFDAAQAGSLSDPAVLGRQVDRMLDDPRTERFVKDFAGQAFRLYEIKATSPDPGLYPEYDDRLGQAMVRETELFLAELIAGNLGAGHLIDADFTFVNRRLADHYGIDGIKGMQMRKVQLPPDSPRGGLLAHASVHKITANGTTTSPIPRGNFVLENLLGLPAPPPPEAVGGIEPDTRGTTTIREQLDAHRNVPVCASCHRRIDPPGFALEAFDPIGGFRTHYRTSPREVDAPGGGTYFEPFGEGLPVDASGVTPEGDAFSGIEDYKRLLLDAEVEQVARNLASQLLVLATGAEVEFADRDSVEQIVDHGRANGHPVRTMIHQVVQNDLFRRQ